MTKSFGADTILIYLVSVFFFYFLSSRFISSSYLTALRTEGVYSVHQGRGSVRSLPLILLQEFLSPRLVILVLPFSTYCHCFLAKPSVARLSYIALAFRAKHKASPFDRHAATKIYIEVKIKFTRHRPGVAQRVGRGIALLFHDRGTRRGGVVSSTPRPHFTPGERPGTHCAGGWVSPRVDLYERKISSPPGFDPGPSSL